MPFRDAALVLRDEEYNSYIKFIVKN